MLTSGYSSLMNNDRRSTRITGSKDGTSGQESNEGVAWTDP
jgi:hypothetical protein